MTWHCQRVSFLQNICKCNVSRQKCLFRQLTVNNFITSLPCRGSQISQQPVWHFHIGLLESLHIYGPEGWPGCSLYLARTWNFWEGYFSEAVEALFRVLEGWFISTVLLNVTPPTSNNTSNQMCQKTMVTIMVRKGYSWNPALKMTIWVLMALENR